MPSELAGEIIPPMRARGIRPDWWGRVAAGRTENQAGFPLAANDLLASFGKTTVPALRIISMKYYVNKSVSI
jgi:hypothetical protein